jgi:hypothetical protein
VKKQGGEVIADPGVILGRKPKWYEKKVLDLIGWHIGRGMKKERVIMDKAPSKSKTVLAGVIGSLILVLGYVKAYLDGQPVDVLWALQAIATSALPWLAALGLRGVLGRIVVLLLELVESLPANSKK